ncbi:MAG: excinuclease ABC subunit UvrC, partial [Planctomycetota bacterium]
MSGTDSFADALRTAPARPGCYLFRDREGRVLYVGKARDLRRRVQVYRRPGADGRARLADLLARAAAAEFLVTESEKEAILLEDRLVKLHQPPLNVLLKDDKSFLLIHLDTRHRWPRLGLARRRRRGAGEFHGPYPSAGAARRAKRLLQRAFGLRDCSDHTLANRSRPCLQHAIGLCSAPCVGRVTVEEYAAALAGARQVLGGRVREHIRRERERMAAASAVREYETALRARDRIRALEALAEPQKVRLAAGRDFDVLGLDERGHFALLEYRDGDWIGTRRGVVPLFESPAAAVAELLPALYRESTHEVPPEILVAAMPEGAAAITEWLSARAGAQVRLLAPSRGEKRGLVRLAEANARAQRGELPSAPWPVVSERLGRLCRLPPPSVVDCIDVSHFQGRERVAARVRFVEGRPERSAYRRYLVGGGSGNDDPGAMREVLDRVLTRADQEGLADLIVLDGGRPQLAAGLAAAAAVGVEAPLAALAKARRGRGPVAAEERVFLPGREQPVVLERGSPERRFLERVRDEAHRFAISHHRRRRENLRLVLEEVPGIGPARRKVLLDHCRGDLRRLMEMDVGELAGLPGIGRGLA